MAPRRELSKRAGKCPTNDAEDSPNKRGAVERPRTRRAAYTEEELAFRKQLNNTAFQPTRFLDASTLREMGILDEVMEILSAMGLAEFALIREFFYPDLCRDFFATVELKYRNNRHPDPNQGRLTFKVCQQAYEISIKDLCGIYGFEHKEQAKFEPFTNINEFWDLVAAGRTTGSPKMSLIRYPPLRIVAKFLACTFNARKKCATVKAGEFAMLFSGVQDKLLNDDGLPLPNLIGNSVNLGCLFAKTLVSVKSSTKAKEPACYLGSLLTPLLKYIRIPLKSFYENGSTDFINRDYLIRCDVLERTRDGTYNYKYWDKDGVGYSMRLPCPTQTTLTNENIRFEYWDDNLARRTSSRAPRFNHSTCELPRLSITKRPRKEFLGQAYKIQDRVNRLAKKQTSFLMKQIKKLKDKIRRISGNAPDSSTDEELPEWNESDEERYGEEYVQACYEEEMGMNNEDEEEDDSTP